MIIEYTLLTIFLLFFYSYFRLLHRRWSLPPGPFPWPIVGNLVHLDPTRPQKSCQKWAKIYGPVFTVWLANQPLIMVTDYELMKDALVKHGDQLAGRPVVWVFDYFHRGNYGIVVSTGDVWKEQRRFSLQILRNFGFGRNIMEERIMTEARNFSASLLEDMDSSGQVTLDMATPINFCVGNIISSILIGRRFEKGDEQFTLLKDTLDENFKVIVSPQIFLINSFPWLRHIPLFGHFGMDEMYRHDVIIRGWITDQLEKHVKEMTDKENEEPMDFIEAYLKEMKRRQREGEDMSHYSEWQLLCCIADLFIAGLETTVTTLRWAILAMMKNPQAQNKVHQEIDAILGRHKTPTMSDRQSMPYVVATLNEVQRWGNILPINLFHTNDTDFQLGGYTIAKDVTVVPQISVLAIDDKVFPQPEQFRPERFLEPDGKTLSKIDQFAPFSMGKRQCLGEGLARAELFLIFVHLMQRFQVSVPEGAEEPSEEPELGFTSAPHPHKCLVLLRELVAF